MEGVDPDALEGIDVILERAQRRVARHSSNVEMYSSDQNRTDTTSESLVSSSPTQALISRGRPGHYTRSPRNLTRSRKTSGTLLPYQETPESTPMIRPSVQRQHSAFSRLSSQADDESSQTASPTLTTPRSLLQPRTVQTQRPESPGEQSDEVQDIHESRL